MKRLYLLLAILFFYSFVQADMFISIERENEEYTQVLPTLKFIRTVNKLNNYRKLLRYNWWHFTYKSDYEIFGLTNYWQYPFEFFANKVGDCEDFSVWNQFVLNQHGYNAQLVLLKRKATGTKHVIVRCEKDAEIVYIDQFTYSNKIDRSIWEVLWIKKEAEYDR